jgi:hypothetical protein
MYLVTPSKWGTGLGLLLLFGTSIFLLYLYFQFVKEIRERNGRAYMDEKGLFELESKGRPSELLKRNDRASNASLLSSEVEDIEDFEDEDPDELIRW